MRLPFAQSILEYSGIGSNSTLSESIGAALSAFWDGVRNVDQNTWLAIGGGLIVIAYLTRRSGRR